MSINYVQRVPVVVGVSGWRGITHDVWVRCQMQNLTHLISIDKIIHGGCRGADKIIEKWAKEVGIPTEEYPADWERYGSPHAAHIRNQDIVDNSNWLVGFPSKHGSGTQDTLARARNKFLNVVEIWYPFDE